MQFSLVTCTPGPPHLSRWMRTPQWGGREGLGLGFVGNSEGCFCLTARVVAALNKKQRDSSLGKQPSLNGPGKFPSHFKGTC